MSAEDFAAALQALEISQARFGRLVGVSKDTPTNWARGRTEIPGAVAILVRLLMRRRVTIAQLETLAS